MTTLGETTIFGAHEADATNTIRVGVMPADEEQPPVDAATDDEEKKA